MTDKKTSDEIAALAAKVLGAGNPLDRPQFRQMMQNMLPPEHREFLWPQLEAVLKPHFEAMVTLAASCVSQADGPEA